MLRRNQWRRGHDLPCRSDHWQFNRRDSPRPDNHIGHVLECGRDQDHIWWRSCHPERSRSCRRIRERMRRRIGSTRLGTDEHDHSTELRGSIYYIGLIGMGKRLTKAAGRRRLSEISSKMFKLYESGYVSLKDVDSVARIVKTRTSQLK